MQSRKSRTKQQVKIALRNNNNHITKTANALRISDQTLRKLIRFYNIDRPSKKGPPLKTTKDDFLLIVEQHGTNVNILAHILGIHPITVRSYFKRWDIPRKRTSTATTLAKPVRNHEYNKARYRKVFQQLYALNTDITLKEIADTIKPGTTIPKAKRIMAYHLQRIHESRTPDWPLPENREQVFAWAAHTLKTPPTPPEKFADMFPRIYKQYPYGEWM